MERLEEEIIAIADELNKELSVAIAEVLKKYGVTGQYNFHVLKDPDYGQKPVEYLKGKRLRVPLAGLGNGCAEVENPEYVRPL